MSVKVADPLAYGGLGRAEFFARNGIRGTAEFDQSPMGYARHLARYITCPSTIRVRVLERYGCAPDRAEIEKIQRERGARLANVMRIMRGGDIVVGDDDDRRRIRSLLGEERRAEQRWAEFRTECAARRMAGKPAVKAHVTLAPATVADGDGDVRSWLELVEKVAHCHGLTSAQIIGPLRWREIVPVRALCCALLRSREHGQSQIGRWLGGRDHSSIGYLQRKWDSRWSHDPALRATYDARSAIPAPSPESETA